jgi:hypothetical protein
MPVPKKLLVAGKPIVSVASTPFAILPFAVQNPVSNSDDAEA